MSDNPIILTNTTAAPIDLPAPPDGAVLVVNGVPLRLGDQVSLQPDDRITVALPVPPPGVVLDASPDAKPPKKSGRGRQDYATPPEFLAAVTRRFGRLAWDLAAGADTTVAGSCWFGPGGSPHGEDALAMSWANVSARDGWLWLNPPFAHLDPWAKKCAEEMQRGARILMLTPASIGTRWFAEHVQPHAHVIALSPRITFVGETAPCPKDLMLSVYCAGLTGFSTWHWWPTKETTR